MRIKTLIYFMSIWLLFRATTGVLVGVVDAPQAPAASGITAWQVQGSTTAPNFGQVVSWLGRVGPYNVVLPAGAAAPVVSRVQATQTTQYQAVQDPIPAF